MNPGLILQGIGAGASLVGSIIPDEIKTEKHQTQTEGSSLAGRVAGVAGPETTTTYEQVREMPKLKQSLLMTGGLLSSAGSFLPEMKFGKDPLNKEIDDLNNKTQRAAAAAGTIVDKDGTPVPMSDTDILNLLDSGLLSTLIKNFRF